MAVAIADKLTHVGTPGTVTSLQSPGHSIAGTSISIGSASNWPIDTPVYFAIRVVDPTLVSSTNPSGTVTGTYTEWKGIVSGTTISSMVLKYGSDQVYPAGANTQVFIIISAARENEIVDALANIMNPDASLKTAPVQAALGLTSLNGYTPLGAVPNTVTYNGNRSYDMVFNGADYTNVLSNGMRVRTTRTVTAPTQCTSLNGTTQYYSKSSPAGMTFTNNFVVVAAGKPSAYQLGTIASRYDGTSGWALRQLATGQIELSAYNAGAANFFKVTSYQSVALNKWGNNFAAQMDMTVTTNSATTNFIMIDGVDVPAVCTRGGTNPTALVQAGNLNIGAEIGGTNPYAGKLAQVAIFNAKVTQATLRSYMSQTFAGTETSLISAYSFNNSINDINTTNVNNLTANGSAVATNADSPFTQDDTGTPSGTNDFAIITKKAFSTNTTITVQVPEGCTIPTSGGVASVVYSSNKVPYGFPNDPSKWTIQALYKTSGIQSSPVSGTYYNINATQLNVPVGAWDLGYEVPVQGISAPGTETMHIATLSTANNSETDSEFTVWADLAGASANPFAITAPASKSKAVAVSTATPYYLNSKTTLSGMASLQLRSDFGSGTVRAKFGLL